ncbi:MAG TPA: hypothetical protein DDW52_26680 [Planctomycetaceae bacterium]|nr:hypothetical protein [Planctomycetaceae bacterium]
MHDPGYSNDWLAPLVTNKSWSCREIHCDLLGDLVARSRLNLPTGLVGPQVIFFTNDSSLPSA